MNKTLIKALALTGMVFGLSLSQTVLADEHEAACAEHIQSKIAWDYDGRKQWDAANIERLCKGTKAPKEPGECFNKVLHGGINWGSDNKWEWQNAINLCAGSNNSDEKISCFQKRVAAGETWPTATLQCQSGGSFDNKVPM